MGITISRYCIGHPVTNITMTTTVSGGFASSNTTSSEGFESGVNKWGQAGARIEFYNEGDRDIKYIDFQLVPFNNVKDIVGGLASVRTVRATGPFKAHKKSRAQWNYIWDGFDIKGMAIVESLITYMDGSTEKVELQQYDGAMGSSVATSIMLMLCSLACFVGLIIFEAKASWQWRISANMPIILSSALMLVLPLLGLLFSRKKDQKLATIFAALNVVPCVTYIALAMSRNARYNVVADRAWMSILLLAISVILLLKAKGVGPFKKYSTSESIVTWSCVGVCTVFTILVFVDLLSNYGSYRYVNEMMSLVMYDCWIMLHFSYVCTVINRYRNDYNVH